MRNLVIRNQLQRGQLLQAGRLKSRLHGANHQVVFVARNLGATLTRQLKFQAGLDALNPQLIVESQAQAQAVVAGTQIGARGGHAHGDGCAHGNIRKVQGRHVKRYLAIGDGVSERDADNPHIRHNNGWWRGTGPAIMQVHPAPKTGTECTS